MISFQEYLATQVKFVFPKIETEIDSLLVCLLGKINTDSLIYTFGNGGSHATSEHFSADLNLTLQRTGVSLRSICISSQISTFTALSNDYSFEDSLELYLQNFLKPDDVVIAFTASGNSVNILRALKKSCGITKHVFALTGSNGGEAKMIPGVTSIHIETPTGEYGIVENLQLSICHYIIDQITSFKAE